MSVDSFALSSSAAVAQRPRLSAGQAAAMPLPFDRPVHFKVTRRLDIRILHFFQRWLYALVVRRLRVPAPFRVPPVPPLERGSGGDFAEADAACTSQNDQLHVLPFNWFYEGDRLDVEVVCRPRDPKDRARYEAVKARYGHIVNCGLAEANAALREENAFLRAENGRMNARLSAILDALNDDA